MSRAPDPSAAILVRFNAAHARLVQRLRDMPAAAAEHSPGAETWSAAQIGWHVALTDDRIADVLLGSTSAAKPAPAGFRETFAPARMPPNAKTFPSLDPPPGVHRDAALERLRASGQRLTKAIVSLSPERGAGYVIELPFGTLTLFELADCAGAYTARHAAQIERAAVTA
jgi:DinB family protein